MHSNAWRRVPPKEGQLVFLRGRIPVKRPRCCPEGHIDISRRNRGRVAHLVGDLKSSPVHVGDCASARPLHREDCRFLSDCQSHCGIQTIHETTLVRKDRHRVKAKTRRIICSIELESVCLRTRVPCHIPGHGPNCDIDDCLANARAVTHLILHNQSSVLDIGDDGPVTPRNRERRCFLVDCQRVWGAISRDITE